MMPPDTDDLPSQETDETSVLVDAARSHEFDTLAAALPDIVVRFDANGRFCYENGRLGEHLASGGHRLLGVRPQDFSDSDFEGVAEFATALERVLRTGDADEARIAFTAPDGTRRVHAVRFRSEHAPDGTIVGAFAVGREITEVDQIRAELERRESEIRSLADGVPDAILRYDVDGRVTFANRHWAESVGRDPAVILGKRPTEAAPDGTVGVDHYEAQLMRVIETGEPARATIRVAEPHGDLRTHSVYFRAHRGDDGAIVGAIAIGRDITDLVRAEQLAIDRERDFRTLAENLPDVVNRLDREGRVQYANRALSEVIPGASDDLGFRPNERELPGIVNVDDYERVLAHVLATGEDGASEIHQILPSGERRTHQILLCAERDDDGDIVGAISIARDVTRLVEVQHQVAEREREFRSLAENNTDLISRYDPNGVRMYVNPALAELFGVSPDELIGQPVSAVIDEASDVVKAVLEVIDDRRARSVQTRNDGALTGRVLVHDVRVIPEFNAAGEFVGVLAIGRDVTDLVLARQRVAEREREFRTLAENNTDYISRYDANGICTYLNPSVAAALGRELDDLIGLPVESIIPESGTAIAEAVRDVIRERVARSVNTAVVNPTSGRQVVHDVRLVPELDASGAFVGVLGIGRDVSELFTAQQQVVDSERAYRTLAENNTDYIARWDTGGMRIYVNPAMANLHGRPAEDLVGLSAAAPGEGSDAVALAIYDVIRDRRPRTVQQELVLPTTGELMVHDVRLIPEFGSDGELVSVLGIGRDVTDALRHQDELAKAARTDALTGIASRAVLYDRLPEVLAARSVDGKGGALVLLDLDGFKAINDHFGHQFGDRLLQEAARSLSRCIGPDDLLVRLGGDEFVMVLSRTETPEDASLVAQQARARLTAIDQIDGIRFSPVEVCMGVALLPSDGDEVGELLAHADMALYEAKRQGRGKLEYYRRDLRSAVERRTTLEHALRACDPDREMAVHLQPIFRLGDVPAVWGAEALLRWEHPELGSIAPDEFIPIAEKTGEIIPLGRWVLRQVAELAAQVNSRRPDPLQFSVNVSSRQFTLGGIEDALREAMAVTGVDPRWLTLELTESLLLDDISQVNRSLAKLSGLGVSLAIDDFGTGYSALQYLTRLDIDHLKIDKSFVGRSGVDAQQREIVRAIIALATALDIGVIAEGIETPAQAAHLSELGCELGQGYLLARPMPSVDFEQWLARATAPTTIAR